MIDQPAWPQPAGPAPLHERLRFTGTAPEYFRIWIVNVALSLVTLGIYAAWAKVRTRRYFYRNTVLAGQPFEYLADPKAILRGNLIVAAAFGLYVLTREWKPIIGAIVFVAGYAALPYLIWKSLRFYAHNSSYRNIRFRFRGTLSETYRTWLLLSALVPLTLGLLFPYWHFRRKKFVVDNFSYGKTYLYFGGTPRAFYRVYVCAGLMALALPLLAGVIGTLYAVLLRSTGEKIQALWLFAAAAAGYFLAALLFTLIRQYTYARLTNYTWRETRAGSMHFESTLRARPLVWLTLTNALAVIATLGLLYPWAKVRRTRYLLENLTVVSAEGLDGFAAAMEPEESALGDAALDFLDFEIGL